MQGVWGNKRADTIVTHKGSGESQGIDVEGVCGKSGRKMFNFKVLNANSRRIHLLQLKVSAAE